MEDICGNCSSIREIFEMWLSFKGSMSKLKPYTVRYRSFDNEKQENCFYAADSYEARMLAMEFNQYINEHPNCIDLIRCEQNSLSNL